MAAVLLPERLWDLIEPLLPVPPPRPNSGRPRVSDRACLTGILFVLRSGISVADVAEGTGLRIWHDVPAAHDSYETEGECRREGFRPARGLASLNTARLPMNANDYTGVISRTWPRLTCWGPSRHSERAY